jgi:hypothetical protein
MQHSDHSGTAMEMCRIRDCMRQAALKVFSSLVKTLSSKSSPFVVGNAHDEELPTLLHQAAANWLWLLNPTVIWRWN